MKLENYHKVIEKMEELNRLLRLSHDLSTAKYKAEGFSIKAILNPGVIELHLDKQILLDAIDTQLAKINSQIGPLEDQISKL